MKNSVSRRDFFKGAGVAAVAAGFTATGAMAWADEEQLTTQASLADQYRNAADALSAVKGDQLQFRQPEGPVAFEDREISASEIASTETVDLLVIGAGISGLMASLRGADLGAKVLCVEKMSKGRACFECFGAVNSKVRPDVDGTSRLKLIDELHRSAYWRVRPQAINTYVDRSGEATDFWADILAKGSNGFIITPVEEAPNTNGMPDIPTELGFYDTPTLPPDAGVRSGYSGMYVCLEMQDIAATNYPNLEIRNSTPAVQLVQDGSGKVTGAIVKNPDGSYSQIEATKGVILCTGGYDANPDMMKAWVRKEDYISSSTWNPGWGTTGDGHMMGLKVGADMDPIPHPVMNFRWGNPDSFYDARVWNPIWYALNVNPDGKRYVNEDLPFQAVSNAQNAQVNYGAGCWQIFDSTMLGFDPDEIALAEEAMAEFEAKGWAHSASSIQALAEACGVNAEGLQQTIDTWNASVAAGVDSEFNRFIIPDVTLPFTGPTYYALCTNSCILATVGGLMINENCQVTNAQGQAIPGLYAAGNASGNFFAGNYPRHIPGTSIGRAITFGYVAADHAVKGA
ncbi:MAG: FAD-binding protein [Eggerthellales bacterium]|nr:FAD-binding protein [Eggerthellales bacterium]